MTNRQTALAVPGDWCTTLFAAYVLAVSEATVRRMTRAGTLTAHFPRSRPGEKPHPMLLLSEVEQVAAARKTAGLTRAPT
jgi:hypothetical protein